MRAPRRDQIELGRLDEAEACVPHLDARESRRLAHPLVDDAEAEGLPKSREAVPCRRRREASGPPPLRQLRQLWPRHSLRRHVSDVRPHVADLASHLFKRLNLADGVVGFERVEHRADRHSSRGRLN